MKKVYKKPILEVTDLFIEEIISESGATGNVFWNAETGTYGELEDY